ncbi:hypothetical protein NBRC116597_17830 [Phaeobacter sp. NW0010-22]
MDSFVALDPNCVKFVADYFGRNSAERPPVEQVNLFGPDWFGEFQVPVNVFN